MRQGDRMFENDVKQYGTQAWQVLLPAFFPFENDVKQYGTQAYAIYLFLNYTFENDVKQYGTQAEKCND